MRSSIPHVVLAIPFLLCTTLSAYTQSRYYDVWHSRDSLGLDFRNGSPVPGNNTPIPTAGLVEGMGSICDRRTGELLFYSNGDTVWNRHHEVMLNGIGLGSDISSAVQSNRISGGGMLEPGFGLLPTSNLGQAPLIVPFTGDSLRYYLFSFDPVEARLPTLYNLVYAVVDMRRGGGLGEVVEKNTLLLSRASPKLVGVRHGNGAGHWIVAHEMGSNRFFAWLATEKGLSVGPVISSQGSAYPDLRDEGFLEASPDGTMLFACRSLGYMARIPLEPAQPSDVGPLVGELFPFDHCTGVVGPMRLVIPAGTGASFSPNNRFLYTSVRDSLFQFDLQVAGGDILKTKKVLNAPGDESYFYGMQLGPNGKIYVLNAFSLVNLRMGVIENPNIPAPTGGNYFTLYYREVDRSNTYGHRIGMPNCIDGYLGETPVREPTDVVLTTDGDTVLCGGEGLPMHVRGAVRYEWTPADGLSCADCPDPVAWPSRRTTYRVVGYRYRPCPEVDGIRKPIDTAWVTIEVQDRPEAKVGDDTTICAGESVQLKGSGEGTYQWSPADGLSCADCQDPVASPTESTTYLLTVTAENGCTDTDSVRISVYPRAARITAPDTTICRGESVSLRASGGKEYQWSPPEGLNCTDCPAPSASPLQTTTYVLRGTTEGICPSFDSVTIVVNDPVVADAGTDTTICVGTSVRLQASGGVKYSWLSGQWLDCDTCAATAATPLVTTTFKVWVVDENGCSAWDSVTVYVVSQGEIAASGDTAFCPGGSARLSVSGAESYRWSPEIDLSCVDCPNPIATPGETTVFYVVGSNASGGCPALDSVLVVVYPLPIADAGLDTAVCAGGNAWLRAAGGSSYRWDPSPDLSCFDCPDPLAVPSATAVYHVTVFSEEGCAARDSVRVVIHPEFVVTAGGNRSVCAGDTVRLQASGGVSWLWEPAQGLSCVDCPDPLAFPERTMTYRVTARSAEGCISSDLAEIRVREFPEVIQARIRPDHRAYPGTAVPVPVEVIDDVVTSDIRQVFLELEYDPEMMVVDPGSIARLLTGTLLEGWSVNIIDERGGRLIVSLIAPPGETLSGRGVLLVFEGRLFISDVDGTDVKLRLSSPSNCYVFESDPGYVRLDSLCGLNLRLIEASAEKYVAPIAYPNPASDRVRFTFGLGLTGSAVMEIFDAGGHRIGLLVDEVLGAGKYEVEWDATDFPSGLYYCRLTSGDWSRTEQVIITQ